MDFNTVGFAAFLGTIATIVLMILAYKFIIPEKKRANLNPLGRFLHDVFNFKFLIIEKVLRFFYVLATIACVCYGVCMIFGINIYHSYYSDKTYFDWYGIYGLLAALIGPFVIRLAYETIMMGILLVKNVMQINKKLKEQAEEDAYQAPSFKELANKENFSFIKNIAKKPEQE